MTLIDTHSHLAMLEHSPLEEILERAKGAGIGRMITVSVDEPSWEPNRRLAESHPHIFFSLGVHPHDAVKWREWRERMKSYVSTDARPIRLVAVGETGLDFHYDNSPREVQIEAFEEQLALAKQWNLPVIIHCREAFAALFASIKKIGLGPRGGVMHCFTGTLEEAKNSVDLGFRISFSGIVTFKNAADLRETAKVLPLSSILIETDCPFLAPIPFRGKPNEPSYLPHTAGLIASVRGMTPEALADATTANAVAQFAL